MIVNPNYLAILLAFISAFLIAVEAILIRKITTDNPIEEVFQITVLIMLMIVGIPSLILYFPDFPVTEKSIFAFTLAGFFGLFLGRFLLYLGIENVGATYTQPISRIEVIIGTILSVLFLGEVLSAIHISGIAILLTGVTLISTQCSRVIEESNLSESSFNYLDVIYPIGAGFFFGVNILLVKIGLIEGTPPLVGLTLTGIGAVIGIFIYFSLTNNVRVLKAINSSDIKLYIAAGIFMSMAISIIYLAMEISTIGIVLPIFSTSPVFVLLLSYLIIPHLELINRDLIIGIFLVVLGAVSITLGI